MVEQPFETGVSQNSSLLSILEKERGMSFLTTPHRTGASWIARPAVGPGGMLFYHIRDGKQCWPNNLPEIEGSIFSSESFQATAPLKAYFDFTHKCNLECRHCITKSSPFVDISRELPTSRIIKLISEFAEIGVLEVATAGGEPFIRPDWKDIFKHIGSVGINLIVTTNGTLITQDISKKLREVNPLQVRVSFEGGPEFNDRVRGKGAYTRALRGLSNLVESGVESCARLTLCRGSDKNLPVLFEDIARLGVRTVKTTVVKEVGRAVESFDENWDYSPNKNSVEWLLSLGKKYHLEVQLSSDDFPISFEDAKDPKLRCPDRSNCGAGFDTCYISPNGEVLGCVAIPNLPFGPLHTESFWSVWRGKLAEDYRRFAEESKGNRLCDSLHNRQQFVE